MAESWVGTLKLEIPGQPFPTRFDADLAIAKYIGWYNRDRLHSSLGDVPPAEFEAQHQLASCSNAAALRPRPQLLTGRSSWAGLSDSDRNSQHTHTHDIMIND